MVGATLIAQSWGTMVFYYHHQMDSVGHDS